MSSLRLLIVGYEEDTQLGAHFLRAAYALNLEVRILDPSSAFGTPWLIRQLNWRILGHRPPRLHQFSQQIVATCADYRPDYVFVTGSMPLHAAALRRIQQSGSVCFNFLSDDPWNRTQRAGWFLKTLPLYDKVFSPRQANLADLAAWGCQVVYLPFGYEPALHFPEMPPPERHDEFTCDILFYGGADKDRLPYARSILKAGYRLHLYGGYWNRDRITRPAWRGFANPQTLRWAVAGAKVSLCLVRRSNRDGHVMRTFEVPAMGGCMIVEDTSEHRQILGDEGDAVVYFQDIEDLLDKLPSLLQDESYRHQLATNAYQRITSSKHRYVDRLKTMLDSLAEFL